jgi:hypothetical protein
VGVPRLRSSLQRGPQFFRDLDLQVGYVGWLRRPLEMHIHGYLMRRLAGPDQPTRKNVLFTLRVLHELHVVSSNADMCQPLHRLRLHAEATIPITDPDLAITALLRQADVLATRQAGCSDGTGPVKEIVFGAARENLAQKPDSSSNG